MCRLKLFIFLIYCSLITSYAQTVNYTKEVISDVQLKLVIERESEGSMQFLRLYSKPGGKLIKEFKLDKSSELFGLDKYYLGERKFIVVAGRYSFFILNLTNKRLIGPLSHTRRGEYQDATSGNLDDFVIFDNGQYLLYGVADFGVYCLSLKDLYNPKYVDCIYDSTRLQGNYMFIDYHHDNLFNIILAKYIIHQTYDRDIEPNMIFKGIPLKSNDKQEAKYTILDNGFVMLNRDMNKTSKDLIINYKSGEIYDGEELDKIKKELKIE